MRPDRSDVSAAIDVVPPDVASDLHLYAKVRSGPEAPGEVAPPEPDISGRRAGTPWFRGVTIDCSEVTRGSR